METEKIKKMETGNKKSVELNKESSKACKRLFPAWAKPPTQGELQRIIIESWQNNSNDKQVKAAGEWWLWIRNIFIENTITKEEKNNVMRSAVLASGGQRNIHLVSSRSPELLHAQVEGLGDQSLPRSRKALEKLGQIIKESDTFLPTKLTLLFADLAVDNFDEISKKCNTNNIIDENIKLLSEIAKSLGLNSCSILKMSQLKHPKGVLGSLINTDGSPRINITLDERAKRIIEITSKESVESQKRMFGWSEAISREHNINLGITMGLVGQSIKLSDSNSILIHNESFISRGMLNNIFNPKDDPLSVVCLKDLLESKAVKV